MKKENTVIFALSSVFSGSRISVPHTDKTNITEAQQDQADMEDLLF